MPLHSLKVRSVVPIPHRRRSPFSTGRFLVALATTAASWGQLALRPFSTGKFLGALAAVLGFTSCQTPNVQPFHEATTAFNAAVRQAYTVTWAQLDAYEAIDSEGGRTSRNATNHPAVRFEKGWAPRLQVMEGLVSYSESLANIVQSGEQSRANAKAISDQVLKLVEATPWSVYGAAANQIFQQVHGLAVSIAQYRSIAKAVAKADAAIQRVGEALGKDMQSVEVMLIALHDDQEEMLIRKYNHHRGYVTEVQSKRENFERELLKSRNATDSPRLELLRARALLLASTAEAEQTEARAKADSATKKLEEADRNKQLIQQALKECDDLLARVAETEAAYQAEKKSVQEARQASLELVKSTRDALRFWADAHTDLKSAIEENRQPNVQLLLTAATEIRETIRKLRNP